MDFSEVLAMPGVATVITAADVPGTNECSHHGGSTPLLAQGEV